jgi:hypothetical protein
MKNRFCRQTAKAVIFISLRKDISENIGRNAQYHKSGKEKTEDSCEFLGFVSHYYIPFGFINFNFSLS